MKVHAIGDNILAKKVEEKKKSEFEIIGDVERNSAVYEIVHCGPAAGLKVGQNIVLKPGSYDKMVLDGETLLALTPDDLVATIN